MTDKLRKSPSAILAFLFLSACGGASTPPTDKAATTTQSATPPAASSAAAEPKAEPKVEPKAEPKAEEKPKGLIHDADGPDGVRRWSLWDGPKTGKAISTKKVWVIAPNLSGTRPEKDSFKSLRLKLVTLVKSDENETVFEERGNKYAVSTALARPAEPQKGIKKGSFVFCSFGGSYMFARVDAIDAKSVTCVIRFMDKTRKEKVAIDEVLAIEGPLGISSPALVRFEQNPTEQYVATIVATSGDDTWVDCDVQFTTAGDTRADRYMHKVKTKDVTPIDISKPLAKGAACLATNLVTIDACTVKEVIDGGLAYVVTFGEGGSGFKKEWDIGTVAPAPKVAK